MPTDDQDIVIGKIVAPFGIRGDVKLVVLTDFPERFDVGNKVVLKTPDGARRGAQIEGNRPSKGGIILKLQGIDTRTDSEALRDSEVVVGPTELGELQSGQFYVFDIIGLDVVTDDGRKLGHVTEVLQGGANDVYVTSTGLCIPALKDVVVDVDLTRRVMVIHPMAGLLPED